MKRLMYFAVLMICASFCWGQDASQTMTDMSMGESAASASNPGGYATTFSAWPAVTDISGMSGGTNYLATNNAWKALPAKTIIAASYLGAKAYVLDSSGCVFFYDKGPQAYTQRSWGCGWAEITTNFDPSTPNYMVGLLKTDAGCPSGTKRFYWSYNDAAPTNTGNCAAHWYGSANGSQLQINRNLTSPLHTQYVDADGTYHDLGTGWTFGNVGPDSACLVPSSNTKTLYIASSGSTSSARLYQPAPPASVAFTSCVINSQVIMVTTGATSYWLDRTNLTNPAWKTVMGATSKLVGPSKGEIFGIVSGNLRHLNVFAAYISATLSGSFTGCPTDVQPCTNFTPTPVHTKTIQIHFPHGLNGAMGTFAGAPTAPNPVSSVDFSAQCDLLFGPGSDPECFAPIHGGVNCSVVNNSIYTPPPPPTCHDNSCPNPANIRYSHDARSYTGDPFYDNVQVADGFSAIDGEYHAHATVDCEAEIPACAPGTPPAPLICPAETTHPASSKAYFTEDGRCEDPPDSTCSKQVAIDRAIGACSFFKHGWGFIEFIAGYNADDPSGPKCTPLPYVEHFAPPVNYPCAESPTAYH